MKIKAGVRDGAGKELAVLLSGQFDKLKSILERIKVE